MTEPRGLAAGDRVRTGHAGTVAAFIPGQNDMPAALVRFDEEIRLPRAAGKYAVLELGHVGATWADVRPRVHVELCDFEPEAVRWQGRRQGVWVESHATYELLGADGVGPPTDNR
jgi:hypothetical protein